VRHDTGALLSSFPAPTLSTEQRLRPSWTEDGRIVVAGGFSNPGLYLSDAGFTTFTRFDPMLSMPTQPSVSPDGKRVAFVIDQHVAVMNLDGSAFHMLTTGDGQESWPVWSPDGSKIGAWRSYTLITFDAAGGGTAYDVVAAHPETFYTFSTDLQFIWR